MSNDNEGSLMTQTRRRQGWALFVDIFALILFFFVADRFELMDPRGALVIFSIFLAKMYFRFITEKGIVSQHELYRAVGHDGDDITRLEKQTANITRNLVFEVSFVVGTILLYSTTIMMLWWITAVSLCIQIASVELLTRSVLLCVAIWLLLEIPSSSMPYLMPWFRTSRLLVCYRVLFGLAINRPKGQQRMYRSSIWAFRVLLLLSIVTLCFLALGACAPLLVPFVGSMYLGSLLFRLDILRRVLTVSHSRERNR